MRPIGLKNKDGITYLNDFKVTEIAKSYKTPLYVLDDAQLKKNIEDYLTYFKSSMFKTTTVYASKALLTLDLAKIMSSYNMSMDAVSLGDLYVIKESGFDMQNVVFHGNNKSCEELTFAISNNVGLIVVDNLYELKLLSSLLKDGTTKVNIMIRINPDVETHTHAYIQTARVESKFGISIYDEETIDEMLRLAMRDTNINLTGFHAHIGSSLLDTACYKDEIDKMVNFQNKINNTYHISLFDLNIGGGFGISYTKEDKALSIKDAMNNVVSYLEEKISSTHSLINHVMIEPGRSIVGNAGITLYTTSQIKNTITDKKYLFIDGGMTDNIRPALYNATYEVDVADKMLDKKEILVDVVGKCCESGDIIRKDVLIPNVNEGDILIVYDTGAYNYAMSSNYNNMLKPAMVRVSKDEIKLVVKREELEDLIKQF